MNSEIENESADAADRGVLLAIADFENTLAKRMATSVLATDGGYAVLNAKYPESHVHNRLQVNEPVAAAAVLAAADRVLGGAGLTHRRVSVADARWATALTPEFLAAGYLQENEVLMVLAKPVAHQPDPRAERLPYRPLVRAAVARDWRDSLPNASDETIRQLADRTELVENACAVTQHAARADGMVVARCALFRAGGVAQIENVYTDASYQRQGLARAVVLDAMNAAADAEIVFLRADANDWPRHFYQRLGFVDRGSSVVFERTN